MRRTRHRSNDRNRPPGRGTDCDCHGDLTTLHDEVDGMAVRCPRFVSRTTGAVRGGRLGGTTGEVVPPSPDSSRGLGG
jgi:hypothetical protein